MQITIWKISSVAVTGLLTASLLGGCADASQSQSAFAKQCNNNSTLRHESCECIFSDLQPRVSAAEMEFLYLSFAEDAVSARESSGLSLPEASEAKRAQVQATMSCTSDVLNSN